MADNSLLPLSGDKKLAFVAELKRSIDADRYPLLPRLRTLEAILARLQPPKAEAAPSSKGNIWADPLDVTSCARRYRVETPPLFRERLMIRRHQLLCGAVTLIVISCIAAAAYFSRWDGAATLFVGYLAAAVVFWQGHLIKYNFGSHYCGGQAALCSGGILANASGEQSMLAEGMA
jgi:hypothetical protein